MDVKRVILGAHPNPVRRPIPAICEKARTVYLSQMQVLFLFKDRRPEAIAYLEALLPQLILGDGKALVKLFWEMPDSSWLEFDYGKRTLSLCSLEKKSPK